MMNLSQARVIDPVLTKLAQGYKHADRVGHTLFPAVPVEVRGGTTLEFGRESFLLYNARRAPGAPVLNIPFGYEGKSFQLVQDALNAPIPRELMQDASKVPGVDLGQRAVQVCMASLTLTLEHEQAELATNPASYPGSQKLALAGAAKWSDPTSNPLGDVEDAKEAVRQSAGVEPNRMVISKPGFRALREHPKVVERFKYTSSDSITAAMLANLFDLDMLAVGKAMRLESEVAGASLVDVWNNSACLAYVPAAPIGAEEPSFGYTYTLKGHPFVEQVAWDNAVKSWVHGVTHERKPVLTGIASGFLFQNVT